VLAILPLLKRLGVPIVLLTGTPAPPSPVSARCVLDVGVPEEACPMNWRRRPARRRPGAGDALALALLRLAGSGRRIMLRCTARGALGWRSLCKVADLMLTG
jgi:arabinose-5-phosphate isomerase